MADLGNIQALQRKRLQRTEWQQGHCMMRAGYLISYSNSKQGND